jgi:preprotein translocase subunit SecG
MKASFKGGLKTMTPNLHAKGRKNFLALATASVSTIFVLLFTAYAY